MYRVFILAFLIFITSGASAIPYQVGDYRIDVTVRNSAMNLIPDVKVAFYRYDQNSFLVESRATGYKSVNKRINIKPNQFIYKTEVVLPDLERQLYVIDHNQKILAAAYVRTDQFGFPSDHYGITAFIPVKMWEPGEQYVEVFDSFWGYPLKKSCAISEVEGYYQVSLSITRKSLKWSGSKLYVSFRTQEAANPRIARRHLRRLNQLSALANRPSGSEEALTFYIYNNFAEQTAAFQEPLSEVYAKYQAARQCFSQLHRE